VTTTHRVTLKDFTGRWQVAREITDHRSRAPAQFTGIAEFTPDDAGLAYLETGQLSLPGQPPFHAERRYHWREGADGFDVHFDDGRFFHSVDPDSPTAQHWCDPDTYDVTYDFHAWPIWSSRWTVTGPRKAYDMITTYTRLDPTRR
jgi:hypothetical protein